MELEKDIDYEQIAHDLTGDLKDKLTYGQEDVYLYKWQRQ